MCTAPNTKKWNKNKKEFLFTDSLMKLNIGDAYVLAPHECIVSSSVF